MANLDPVEIFERLCRDIPVSLRKHVIVTGSLAAAYEYRVKLQSMAVNTKDADLIVHPAGDIASAREMAERLLSLGWRRTPKCRPSPASDPVERLWAIRLMPPGSNDYFIELLKVPVVEQQEPKEWVAVQLEDGWYGLPSFKFMGLVAFQPRNAKEGLEYASPAMMALANLLSHSKITDDEIESGEFQGIRRCAKDLGRVLALVALAGRDATARWTEPWREGLRKCFPTTWRDHALRTGHGLRALLNDAEAIEEARTTTESGLLKGMNYGVDALRAFGERLLTDSISDFQRRAESAISDSDI